MNIFVSNSLNETQHQQLLAAGPQDMFFLHEEFEQESPPHPDFLESQVCFGNVPPSWLTQNPKLEWLQLISVGFGEYLHLDWERLSPKIQMTNLAGFFTEPVAQSMLAGVLALYRGIDRLVILKETRNWVGDPVREELKTLDQATVLLYGFGSINRRFAELIAPFGCRVLTLNSGTTLGELDQHLTAADVVVSTVPDTPETHCVFNSERLERFRQGSLFVNFGRGSVVDENALIEGLKSKKIGGAVIDVTTEEPLPKEHDLWGCPNTLITQHSGGGMADEIESKIDLFGFNLTRFRNGEALEGLVDLEKGY